MNKHWSLFILRWRFAVFALVAGVTALAFIPASNLRFDFNFQAYCPEGDQNCADFTQMQQDFPGQASEYVLFVEDEDLFSKEKWTQLQDLALKLKNSPYFLNISSVCDLPPGLFGKAGKLYKQIQSGEKSEEKNYNWLRKKLLKNPLVEGMILFKEGKVTLIRAVLQPGLVDDKGREKVRVFVDDLIKSYNGGFDRIYHTGFSSIRAEFAFLMKKEQLFLFALVFALLFLVLSFFLGLNPLVLYPLLTAGMAMVWVVALSNLLGIPFTVFSSSVPLLVFIIGISDSLHIFYHHQKELREGKNRKQAIAHTFKHLGRSCFLTSVTTSAGFFALLFTDLPILQEYGLFAATGVMLHYIIMMLLLPGLLYQLPLGMADFKTFAPVRRFQQWLVSYLEVLPARGRRWLPAFLLGVVFLIIGCFRVQESNKILRAFTDDTYIVQKLNRADSLVGGMLPFGIQVEYDSTAEDMGAILTAMDSTQRWLVDKDWVVSKSFSPVDLFTVALKSQGISTRDYPLSDISYKNAAPLLDSLEKKAPDLLKLFINREEQQMIIRTWARDVGPGKFRAFADSLKVEMNTQFGERRAFLSGNFYVNSIFLPKIIRYILYSFWITFLVILLGFWIGFRSLSMALISIVPNLIPLLGILGFLGWTGITMDAAVAVVFTIVYGIAVNDTIHFLSRFLDERSKGGAFVLKRVVRDSSMPILASSLVLMAGFGSLLFTNFIPMLYLGMLLSVGILSAIFGDLMLLPLLLRVTGQRMKKINRATGRPKS